MVERLTADPVHPSRVPHVSADGGRIVWSSEADPLGANADHNEEIFLYETATATLYQLTDTTGGRSSHPRNSDDGAWVTFKSSAPFFEVNPFGVYDPYRVSVTTLAVERLGGLRRGGFYGGVRKLSTHGPTAGPSSNRTR